MKILPHKLLNVSIVFITLVVSLLPIIQTGGLVTLDGPTHVYSANIMGDLLYAGETSFSEYYEINSMWVPNVVGHIVIVIISAIFGAKNAEMIFQIVLVSGLVLSCGKLIATISGKWYPVILAIPLVYSSFFVLGFYNFIFGLILYFFFLDFLLQKESFDWKGIKEWGLLFFVFGLIYFSHFFVFGITCVSILVILILKNRRNFRDGMLYFSPAIPFVLMGLIFILSNSQSSDYSEVFYFARFYDFFHGSPLVGYHDMEYTFVTPFISMVALLCGISLYRFQWEALKNGFKRTHILGITGLLLLSCFIVFPNSNGWSGYIADRFGYVAITLFTILAASSILKISKIFQFIILSIVLLLSVKLSLYYVDSNKTFQQNRNDIQSIALNLEDKSTVLPIYNLGQFEWLYSHSGTCLGNFSNAIVLDNYQAFNSYFPVRFSDAVKTPVYNVMDWNFNPQKSALFKQAIRELNPGYILIIGKEREEDLKKLNSDLESMNYHKTNENNFTSLYKLQ